MQRFFVETPYQEQVVLSGAAAHHLQKVLRVQTGTRMQLAFKEGGVALAEIVQQEAGQVTLFCLERLTTTNEPVVRLTLAQGLAKGEKMDFIIQKAVELGVNRFYPVAMHNSVVRLDEEKAAKKVQRWQKIAEAAAKQSKRDFIPQVMPVVSLEQLFQADESSLRLLAYEAEVTRGLKCVLQQQPLTSVLVIVGPEGGFTEAEVQQACAAGGVSISLGQRILRTETAGLAALAAILYEAGDLGA